MDSVDYYNKYANVYFENTVNLDMMPTLDKFLAYVKPGGNVLDLGCGSGRDAKIMMERELEVTLLDASKEMCALADIYTGLEPLCMDMREMDFDEVFHGIWACASLLHIAKKEAGEVLRRIYQALKPGGVCYVSVKEGEFEGFRHERFFADYTVEELTALIQKETSFTLLDCFLTEDVRNGREGKQWVNVLLKKDTK